MVRSVRAAETRRAFTCASMKEVKRDVNVRADNWRRIGVLDWLLEHVHVKRVQTLTLWACILSPAGYLRCAIHQELRISRVQDELGQGSSVVDYIGKHIWFRTEPRWDCSFCVCSFHVWRALEYTKKVNHKSLGKTSAGRKSIWRHALSSEDDLMSWRLIIGIQSNSPLITIMFRHHQTARGNVKRSIYIKQRRVHRPILPK